MMRSTIQFVFWFVSVSGVGSGTTPTIMGSLNSSNSGDGLYIVITDDAVVMNVLVIDAMTGKEVTRERVDFGQPNIRESTTEQSVLVVQNKLGALEKSSILNSLIDDIDS